MATAGVISNRRNAVTSETRQFQDKTISDSSQYPRQSSTASQPESRSRLEAVVRELLIELGADIHDQHFRGTPARVASLYRELTHGYRIRPEELLVTFTSSHHELIVVSDINFYSLCPHHLLIYRGKMHFGYVPDGKIVGLSKIPRLIQGMAARLIVQEDLVSEIADTFMAVVRPLGCVVKATGRHDCMAVRGVKCHEASMTTVALRGVFREKPSLTEEFHQVLSTGGRV